MTEQKLFIKDEMPTEIFSLVPEGAELRCPHYVPKKRGICNKLFCKGDASPTPQEFLCQGCGNKTVFQKII